MTFPANLRYTKDHEWVSLSGNIATIGITDFAQRELGDIVYVDIDTVGKELSAESIFGLSVFISVIQSIISAICCAINLVLLYRVNCSFDNCPMDFLKSDSHSSCFSS